MAETPRSVNNDLNVTACFMPQASQNLEFSFFVSIQNLTDQLTGESCVNQCNIS